MISVNSKFSSEMTRMQLAITYADLSHVCRSQNYTVLWLNITGSRLHNKCSHKYTVAVVLCTIGAPVKPWISDTSFSFVQLLWLKTIHIMREYFDIHDDLMPLQHIHLLWKSQESYISKDTVEILRIIHGTFIHSFLGLQLLEL